MDKKQNQKKFDQILSLFLHYSRVFFYSFHSMKFDRLMFLVVLLAMFMSLIIWRLFSLQIIDHNFYEALASERGHRRVNSTIIRGNIYVEESKEDGKLFPLAINRDLNLVYAIPKYVEKPSKASRQLSKILEIDRELLEDKLSKEGDPYEPLKNKVDENLIQDIDDLNLKGIRYVKEKWRYYPSANVFAHVLGFEGFKDEKKVGLYGVEGYYNDVLNGGIFKTNENAKTIIESSSDRGHDIILTLDRLVQHQVCKKLSEYVEYFNAKSGSVIIMDPFTGGIIAMCNYPNFDPNEYNIVENISIYNNQSIFHAYEPGSTFKSITMAAALDMNLVNPNTTYTDEGVVKIGKYKIRNSDFEKYGIQTMTDILEKSLNTGAIYVSNQVGFDSFRRYVKEFGFGDKTMIDMHFETRGDLSSLKKRSQIYLATGSFGQGFTVTPIQLVTAYGAIANGGKLMKPYIVKKIIGNNGEEHTVESKLVRQVISPRTSTLLGGMMVSVVQNGHAKGAGVPGYYIGGKTGTAQLHDAQQGGYSESTIHSFVGFGPLDDPKFVMITKIDEPENARFSSQTAAPLFGEIAKYLLEYYQIPKDY